MSVRGLGPVTTSVACAGGRHELHWTDGVLSAPHHPSADRERALAALGADPAPCLQIVDAWHRHTDDLDVLVVAARGPADPLPEPARDVATPAVPGRAFYGSVSSLTTSRAVGWASYRPLSSMRRRYVDYEEAATDELSMLLGLGPALAHRLTATVIDVWADRIATGDERVAAAGATLDAAVYGRVSAALHPWLGDPVTVELSLQRPDGEPTIAHDGSTVSVALPFAWLRDVWVPGLAVVLDRFCLHAQYASGTWTLDTVGRAFDDPAVLTVGSGRRQ